MYYIIVLWPSAQDGLGRTQIISSDFDKFIYNAIGDNMANDFRQTNTNLYIITIMLIILCTYTYYILY